MLSDSRQPPPITIDAICTTLAALAPLRLAESWDNVGLLVGDRQRLVQRVLTCLTISGAVIDEAIEQGVGLIITHHPLPFRPLQRLTSDSIAGMHLLRLIRGDIAVYSAHTAFDSAAEGINHAWAKQLGLDNLRPLVTPIDAPALPAGSATSSALLGSGRYGELREPQPLAGLVRHAARRVGATAPRLVGDAQTPVSRVGIACGSGGSFVAAAKQRGCDVLLTGEATFHQCLEAESLGLALGLLGHYHSERFAMEGLAERLAALHPELTVWASRDERDPLQLLSLD